MTIYRGLGGLHLSLRRLYIIVVIDCGVWHLEDNDGKIYRKTTVPESFFNKAWGRQLYLKVTLAQVFSYEFCKISKNTFFTEHLWATASKATIKSSSWNFFFFLGGGRGGMRLCYIFFAATMSSISLIILFFLKMLKKKFLLMSWRIIVTDVIRIK